MLRPHVSIRLDIRSGETPATDGGPGFDRNRRTYTPATQSMPSAHSGGFGPYARRCADRVRGRSGRLGASPGRPPFRVGRSPGSRGVLTRLAGRPAAYLYKEPPTTISRGWNRTGTGGAGAVSLKGFVDGHPRRQGCSRFRNVLSQYGRRQHLVVDKVRATPGSGSNRGTVIEGSGAWAVRPGMISRSPRSSTSAWGTRGPAETRPKAPLRPVAALRSSLPMGRSCWRSRPIGYKRCLRTRRCVWVPTWGR